MLFQITLCYIESYYSIFYQPWDGAVSFHTKLSGRHRFSPNGKLDTEFVVLLA